MVDLKQTLTLIGGAITQPEDTWHSYRSQADDWRHTALQLTVPLVVGSVLINFLIGWLVPGSSPLGGGQNIVQALWSIPAGLLGAAIVALVTAWLAGVFKGQNSFALGLAATSLAFVPGYIGRAVSPLPGIGWLLSLGLSIYGLVLLWRILPLYLGVPDGARVRHYVLSLILTLVAMVLLGGILGAGKIADMGNDAVLGGSGQSAEPVLPGLLGGLERSGKIVEQAEQDSYTPPADGKISDTQMQALLVVLRKTNDYRQQQVKKLEAMADQAEKNDAESIGMAFGSMSGIVSLSTAEIEIVKTAGGNWAEHQWVKEQLHIARLQQDINDAVRHNYGLYQQYAEQLQEVGYF